MNDYDEYILNTIFFCYNIISVRILIVIQVLYIVYLFIFYL
jgi:hypothetical protein